MALPYIIDDPYIEANFASLAASIPAVTNRTTFTPTISFQTPGDLSVAYTTQTGAYAKIGAMVLFWINLAFTPTYTTASGNFLLSNPPVLPSDDLVWSAPVGALGNTVTWPAGVTSVVARLRTGATITRLYGLGSGIAPVVFSATQFPTGVAVALTLSGAFF